MGEELVKKLSVRDLLSKKHLKEPISWLTCYDFSFATALNETSLDLILVGDSGGMVSLGYKNTNPVSLDEMIILSSAVRRGAPDKFIVLKKQVQNLLSEICLKELMKFQLKRQ